MKTLKKIFTIAFLTLVLSSFAQDARLDKIKNISDAIIANCEGAKYGKDSVTAITHISLYQEYYGQKAYSEALNYWRYLIFNAPKSSENLYIRGVKMYKTLAKDAKGELKHAYRDTIFALHDARIHCFGSSPRKEQNRTFDWYSYRKRGNEKVVFDMFTNTYDAYKSKNIPVSAKLIKYYIDMAVYADKTAHVISSEDVLNVFEKTTEVVDANISGKKGVNYANSQKSITEVLDKNGYLNCENIVPMTEKMYRANPDDETTIKKAYKKLKAGSCTEGNPLFIEIATKMLKIQPSVALYKYLAVKEKKAGNINKTIEYYNGAISLSTESSEKLTLLTQIANTYYKKGSYGKAKEYANKMLAINPNSGKAYIIIGKTYALSSCNPGVAQAKYWAAVDKFQKAKAIDSSVSSQAQKLINSYSQHFPTKNDLFMISLKVGSSYEVGCLGVTTTVRTSD